MKQVTLAVQPRTETGSGPAGRLRRAGRVPVIMYGGEAVKSFSVDAHEFRMMMREISGETAMIELKDGSDAHLCLLKELDRNSITDRFDHIDFFEVNAKEPVSATVRINMINEMDCVGVKVGGGLLEQVRHEVEVRALPSKLPSFIEVDVKDLEAGEVLHIDSLPALDGVEYMDDAGLTVIACSEQHEEEPEEDDAAPIAAGAVPTIAEEKAEAAEKEAAS